MKLFCKALFTFFLFPLLSFGQSNYKPGYIVTLKGDTIKGFIDYREWDLNPNSINFKSGTIEDKVQQFDAQELNFFNVEGFVEYQRYEGSISMDNTDVNHLSNGRNTNSKNDIVFLKVLQGGSKIVLYSYFDGFKRRFYIADNADHLPVELVYRLYTNSEAELQANKSVVENTYMKQLFAVAHKYGVLTDALQVDIEHSGYNAPDILVIVSKINGISKTEYEKKYNEKRKVDFFAGIAANITTFSVYGPYQSDVGKASSSYSPAISFGADLFGSPHTGKLIFRAEVIVSGSEYTSAYKYTGSPYVPVRYSYKQLGFAFAPQVVYNLYNTDKLKIHMGLGIALTYYKYYDASYDLNYAATQVSKAPMYPGFFNNTSFPIMIKAGLKLKNFDFFASYFVSNNISNDSYFLLHAQNTQIGLDYFFN